MRENRGVAAVDRFMAARALVPDGKAYMKNCQAATSRAQLRPDSPCPTIKAF